MHITLSEWKIIMIEIIKYLFINLFLLIVNIVFFIPLLINKCSFLYNKRRYPFSSTLIMKLINKHPLVYELSVMIWNFPILDKIYSNVLIKQNEKVLQVGCGTGLFNKTHRYIKQIDNLDINLNYLKYGIKRRRFNTYINKSFYDIGKEQKSYDVILFARCFHHLKRQKAALKVCSALLNKNGRAIIYDPVSDLNVEKKTQYINTLYDGMIYNYNMKSFESYIKSILPNDLVIDRAIFKKNLTVTNYNYKYPHTDALIILKKKL